MCPLPRVPGVSQYGWTDRAGSETRSWGPNPGATRAERGSTLPCPPGAAKRRAPPLRCARMSYRPHAAPSRLPSSGSGGEWAHVKVTMPFAVFDVRALVDGPLHEKPGVGVQQISRAAEHDEP